MRCLTFLLTILLVVYLGSSTPINPKRLLINRPTEDYVLRSMRSPPQNTKNVGATKGQHSNHSKLELSLKKGEYVCGDKVCSLQPGEIPKGCVYCQYRIR